MNIDLEKISYTENGYFTRSNLLSSDQLFKIQKFLDNSNPKTFIPYSENVPWGYGQLLDNHDLNYIFDPNSIVEYLSNFVAKGHLKCNLMMIANKPEFIGPDVEWHQEFLNINTYAPGYDPINDLDKFLQVFIAIDECKIENGPLYVFEGSHKLGLLPCEDIINSHLNHKRRIKHSSLLGLSNNYNLKPILLKPGDAIVFNHLLVHGSPTNFSNLRRRALILQYRIDSKKRDESIHHEEVSHRKNFMLKQFRDKQSSLTKESIYEDVKGVK